MNKNKENDFFEEKQEIVSVTLSYLFSLVIAVLGVFVWFTAQDTAIILLQRYNTDTFGQSMANASIVQAITVVVGLAWVITFFVAQHYFEKKMFVEKAKVLKWFFLTSGIEVLLLVFMYLLKAVL